jgi:hypothetical protein
VSGNRRNKRAQPDESAKRIVFVSHSAADTWVAKQIARAIAECGATSFVDEADIDAGTDFEEIILASLERADELVVLITPWALDRPYIWVELGAAWSRRIPIVALLHGMTAAELQARPSVPVFLKRRHLLEPVWKVRVRVDAFARDGRDGGA